MLIHARLVSIFLALVIMLSACGGAPTITTATSTAITSPLSEGSPSASPEASPSVVPTNTPAPTATTEPTPTVVVAEAGASRSNPLPLETEVQFETWAVTVTEVLRGADANTAITQANQFNEAPSEGNEYLLATIALTNIGDEQKAEDVNFGVSVRITGDRNILYSRQSVVPPQQLEGQLFPGGTTSGQLVFEVPIDEQNLMFRVEENFSLDATAVRYVAAQEGAAVTPDPALADITATDLGTTRAAPAKLGETVVTENFEITLVEAIRGEEAATRITEANQFNEPAPSGEEFVAVKMRVRYIGTESPDRAENITGGSFKITGAKNVVYERPSVVAPDPILDANLFPGGVIEGWEVLQVEEGEQGLVVIFSPLLSFSDEENRFLALE